MSSISLTNKQKFRIFFARSAVFIASLATNTVYLGFLILLVFIHNPYFSGTWGVVSMFTLLIAPSFLFSLIFMLITNNTIQDFFSGFTYEKNTRFRLFLKIILKHILLLYLLLFPLFQTPSNIYEGIFVYTIPMVMVIFELAFLISKTPYTSIYNLILRIKK
jgi:hypothetical protein